MRIESVDLFYLRLPTVEDIGDGSQDALLVRIRGGGAEGWGECEASPLPSIAAWCAPISHSACHPVEDAIRGLRIETPDDIRTANLRVRELCLDLLQAAHTLSGIDTALWDLLARHREVSIAEMLGLSAAYPKQPYASVLFGDTSDQTLERARRCREEGFRAAKFGWGPYGRGDVDTDTAHVEAARAGMGDDAEVLIDAGTVWFDDLDAATARLPALQAAKVGWLEEPFVSGALSAYRRLATRSGQLPLAAGEGAHTLHMAEQLVTFGGVGFLQIDTGRIGGISTARDVSLFTRREGVRYVNHTFTSNLALVASLAPYWDDPKSVLCEYPVALSALARDLTIERLAPDADGLIRPPEGPGLGVRPDPETIGRYLVDVRIEIDGQMRYRTPSLT